MEKILEHPNDDEASDASTPSWAEKDSEMQLGAEASDSSHVPAIIELFNKITREGLTAEIRKYFKNPEKAEMLGEILEGLRPTDCYFVITKRGGWAPIRATAGSVGYDLFSREKITIPPYSRRVFDFGIAIETPGNYLHCEVKSRSGLACKKGIEVVGSGIIDTDYQHGIKAVLENRTNIAYTIYPGHRIAQLVFRPYIHAKLYPSPCRGFEEGKRRTQKHRGSLDGKRDGGFGSTGC